VGKLIEAAVKAWDEEHATVGSKRDVRVEEDGVLGYAPLVERGAQHAVTVAPGLPDRRK